MQKEWGDLAENTDFKQIWLKDLSQILLTELLLSVNV